MGGRLSTAFVNAQSNDQGPVVQSVVSLSNTLVVKILTVLLSTISHSQVFLLKKMWVAFAKLLFFSKNISVYAIFNDQNFNNTLTNDIVSFEQLAPGTGRIIKLNLWYVRWPLIGLLSLPLAIWSGLSLFTLDFSGAQSNKRASR